MKKDEERDIYLLSSVDNSLRILELFMVRDQLRLKDIAAELNLDRTSAFKMLHTLCSRGFLFKDEHARYSLGPKLSAIRQLSQARNRILDAADPSIYRLWALYQKTIFLSVPAGDDRLLVLYMKTEHNQDSIYGRTGAAMDIHTTGAGKVLAAFMEDELRENMIERYQFRKLTENTITDKDEFRKCLAETKKLRWGIAIGENREDHCDLAVPVFDYTGACVATIGLVTDRQSMNENLNEYLSALNFAGTQISMKLGYAAGSA